MRKLILFLALGLSLPSISFSQEKGKMPKHRDGGPSKAAIFEIERTKDPATGKVPKEIYLKSLQRTVEMKKESALRGTAAFSWTERGPISDVPGPSNGNTRANSGLASGRIRAVMVDSTDATKKTVWIGGVDGGLWKTTDITQTSPTWTLVNDYLSNLAIAAICQDPRPGFQNIMYFCTGESYFNADAVQGVGVFKSTDGGATWNFLASTSSFVNGTRILCDFQGNVYLATRGSGLRRSTDGGTNWTNITPTGLLSDICDLEISSTSAAGRLHVVSGIFSTQAYRYTDIPATVAAGTWTAPALAFPSYAMRCEIAVSGSTLYACPVNANYQIPTIYKSTNGGANWAATTAQPAGNWANSQGWYDVEVGIDPSNVNNVIVGGLDTYKTINGGTSWTKMSEWVGLAGQYVHADIHKISWWDGGNKLVIASDGGVFYSSDKGTIIRDRNLGLRIKQFYSCAIHPTTTNYFLAGAQDNGVHQFNNAGLSNSIEVSGGDGAFVAIDQNQSQYQFGSYVYNIYRRSINNGANWSTCTFFKGSPGTKFIDYFDFGSFINPFDYDNTNNIMYAGADGGEFFRWTTAQTTAAGTYYSNTPFPAGASIVTGITGFNGSNVSAVFVSPYTANLVYFGTEGGRVVTIAGANTAANGTAGTNITGASFPAANVSCINAGTNDNNLIVSFSNYSVSNVWVSTNGGTSWTAIDGNLPNMPVRWCMFYPGSNTKAIIATETGVWQTDLINGASTVWVAENTFPTVRTDMLKYRASDGTLAAATHGRGLWTASLLCAPPPVSVNPTNSQICNPGGAGVTLTALGATTYAWSPATGLSATTGAIVTATPTTTTTYTVTGTDGAGCTNTAFATVTVLNKPTLAPTATPATVCSGNNSVLNAGATLPAFTYCSTSYASGTGSGDWISLVQIASTTLNNPSGAAGSPYYTLYPATGSTTASLAANTAYTMTVSGGTFGTCFVRGWIDYNQDGVFSSTESIGISPNVGASATGTIVFTPAFTAINGQTRLRLRSSDTNPGPGTGDFCNATNSGFGETEDYVITITGGVPQFTYLWSPSTFLSSTTTNPTNANAVTATTNYSVNVTAYNGCFSTSNVSVTLNTVTVTNPATTTGTAGVVFSQTFTQTGAVGGATFTLNTGTLPTGLTISSAGVLSGTPIQTGTFPITVRATGGNGCIGNGSTYNLVISCQAITVTNPATTTGTAGVVFSQTFTQTGAVGGATFTLNTGTLPTGLTISSAGVLSGTPTQTGTFPITVRATGGNGCFGNGSTYNLVISCQAITVTNPATTTGTAGVVFSQTFTQTGAVGGATFTLNTGTLPTGLTISSAGVLSGTPTQTGTFPITVRATGGNGCIGNGSTYNLVISCQAITVTNPGTTTGTAGVAFSQTFTQTGAVGGATFTLNTGTLPTGLTLSTAGLLSGTTTQTGTFPITVRATGGNGCIGNGSTYNLVISCQAITVTNPGTTTGTAGVAFSQTFTQTGAVGGATFTLNTGTLPTGLTLSSAGVLSGTPTQTGTFPITVRATGGNGCIGNGSTYNLVISCQAITVTNPGTTTGTAGVAFSQTFTQTGAVGGATFTLNSGTLPIGLTLSAAGVLSGTPTQTGTFPITVRATGGNGCIGNGSTYNLVISCQAITVTNPATTTGTAGVAFSQTFTQTGAVGGATFTLNSGTLPTGLTLSSAGVLSGTPTQTGTFSITVRATGGNGCIGNGGTYNLVINSSFTTLNLKAFIQGFYTGSSTMRANMFDLGMSGDPDATDNITVNLWSPASLSNPLPNHTLTTMLRTNGTATMQFPAAVSGNSFYIAVKHRNSLETWSKTPVPFTTITSYDFSTGLIKAYDDGVNPPLASMGSSVFAIYSGDVNSDGAIDASDMGDVDNDVNIFAFGYNNSDVTGDGASDASDLTVLDNNQPLFLFYSRPF